MHPGGARTALINYLFAKSAKGQFVLRIEDTDQARGQEAFLKQQLEDLKWLGLNWDEGLDPNTLQDIGPYGPYRQTGRLSLYKKCVAKLIQEGKAYHCFLTPSQIQKSKQEALQKKQPFRVYSPYRELSEQQAKQKLLQGESAVIRFKVPQQKKHYELQDVVRGKLCFPSDMVGDFVLVRSTGLPVYNFACAVDDHQMQISHVFRSEEHLPNTLRQMMIFEAFNWPLPVYGHLSLILGENKKKLSKREGAVSCGEYKKRGYLPGAFVNFLALMGWNPKTEKEIFSLTELVSSFSLKGLNPSPGVFDVKKLDWMNGQHWQTLPVEQMLQMTKLALAKENLKWPTSKEWRSKVGPALKQVTYSLPEAKGLLRSLSEEYFEIDKTAHLVANWPSTPLVLKKWIAFLESYSKDFLQVESFALACSGIKKDTSLKGKFLFMPLRVAILGQAEGTELKSIITLINKNVLLKRARIFLQKIENKGFLNE